ncbi:FAD-binding protein [Spirillospora sp. CA-294931]|uniref:FAD-binding protein n=1 Tax=Spirillospora sp. CA-294931 TaxID=3240042 RepID=UPI003D8F8749
MRDFGGTVERTPARVLRPRSAAEVADAVRTAPTIPVPRGTGHSTQGQSLTTGASLDLRAVREISVEATGVASVGAGATWRDVLEATLSRGWMPPVLTDLLDISVGGSISAGGIGGTSHVHGTQADNVLELDVVTGDGAIVTCSPERRRELFDAVRAGQGRHGVIVRAALRLVPAPRRVLACKLAFGDAEGLLAAQREIRADHVSGQAKPLADGGWRFEAKAVLYDGERPVPGSTDVEELPFLEFADRMRPDVDELIRLGEWERPHPWEMVLLPGDRAAKLIGGTLAAMGPEDIGLSGLVMIKALRVGHVPRLRAPAEPVLFSLLRTASPGCRTAGEMRDANAALLAEAHAQGGVRYPPEH